MKKRIDKTKFQKLVGKGDKLFSKGKFKRALKKYKKAKEYDPDNTEIYDKLIKTHEAATDDWIEKDVALSVGWLMEKQEIEHPTLKMLHAKLTPEWRTLYNKIMRLFECETEGEESRIIEEIRAAGEEAIYPLIYTLLVIKKGPNQGINTDEEEIDDSE